MRTVTKDNITEVFLGYFGQDTDPRLREVLQRARAAHLHAFARGDRASPMPNGARASSSWNGPGRDHRRRNATSSCCSPTCWACRRWSTWSTRAPAAPVRRCLGPFHVSGAPPLAIGGDMKRDFEGEVVLVEGIVRDMDGNPIAGAEIDIWQTAPNGLYSSQDPEQDIIRSTALMTTGRRRPLRLHHGQAGQLHGARPTARSARS